MEINVNQMLKLFNIGKSNNVCTEPVAIDQ